MKCHVFSACMGYIQSTSDTWAIWCQISRKVDPRTILKNQKQNCGHVFQNFFYRDQNPNSSYLQGQKAYFSHLGITTLFMFQLHIRD